jgi:hypothetical protein
MYSVYIYTQYTYYQYIVKFKECILYRECLSEYQWVHVLCIKRDFFKNEETYACLYDLCIIWICVSHWMYIKRDFFRKEETYMPLWFMYHMTMRHWLYIKRDSFKNDETCLYDLYIYRYKYNYKTGLSAKMCNRIFDCKTTFHISACINIYNQVVDKIKREYTVATYSFDYV